MKILIIMLLASGVVFAGAGCRPAENISTGRDTTNISDIAIQDRATNAWRQLRETSTNVWADLKTGATDVWANVKQGTTNAWANLKDSTRAAADEPYDRKESFLTKARNDMDALDARIKELTERAANASETYRADAQNKLEELRAKRTTMDPKFEHLKNATESEWNDVKAGFQNAYDETKDALKSAWQWLDEKINS